MKSRRRHFRRLIEGDTVFVTVDETGVTLRKKHAREHAVHWSWQRLWCATSGRLNLQDPLDLLSQVTQPLVNEQKGSK